MNLPPDEPKSRAAEVEQIQEVADRLLKGANATSVYLIDKYGQLIAASGAADERDSLGLRMNEPSMYERDEVHVQRVSPVAFRRVISQPSRDGGVAGRRGVQAHGKCR